MYFLNELLMSLRTLNEKLEVGETRHIDHISWGSELKAFLGSNALPQGHDSWSKEFQNFISEFS